MAEIAPSNPKAIKRALRQRILAQRDQIDAHERARISRIVLARVRELPEYRAAGSVFSYAGFGSELDTFPFLQRVVDDGKTLVMSRVDKSAQALRLYRVADVETQLVPGIWGIREPDPRICPPFSPDAVDFVLMPGAVFDVHCGRIGYGAGFYDQLLAPLNPLPYLVAGAYDLQVVEEVPMEPHDRRVDRLITEERELGGDR